MGEQTSDAVNFDLNLGPIPEPAADSTAGEHLVLADDWTERPARRINDPRRHRSRLQWRSQHLLVPPDAQRHVNPPPASQNIPMELNQFVETPAIGTAPQVGQVGQDSVEVALRSEEVPKACENNNSLTRDEELEKNDVEKGIGDDGSFFDCNICLDLAKDPVVTCCGHLFCWPCLYRWLHMHSDAKECPVCKGEVSYKSITPIYGRGNNNVQDPEEDPSLKIPLRPHGRRVESSRPTFQRSAFENPMDMIRRFSGRVDLARSGVRPHDPETARETAERTSFMLNRFLTSRAIRREQNLEASSDDPAGNNVGNVNLDSEDNRMLQSFLLRRIQLHHRAAPPSFPSASSSAERVVETYFRARAGARNQEQAPPAAPADDRDSYSSIAAVINSESQVDTAAEIDSMVSLSTSSSRRRNNDSSRVSDVDTEESRAPRPRRRRLH